MADAACAGPAAYRPRRPRDSPLYRLAEAHHETFKQVYDERFAGRYGSWRAEIGRSLFAFLDCGVEERGFARVRCDACRREFRVALSCKTRVYAECWNMLSTEAAPRATARALKALALVRGAIDFA